MSSCISSEPRFPGGAAGSRLGPSQRDGSIGGRKTLRMMAGFLDNFRWPECDRFDWGERRNAVASVVAGFLVSGTRMGFKLDNSLLVSWLPASERRFCFSAVLHRLVDHDRCCSHVPISGNDEPFIPHMWSLFHHRFLHVRNKITVGWMVGWMSGWMVGWVDGWILLKKH